MAFVKQRRQSQPVTPGVTCFPLKLGVLDVSNVFFVEAGAGRWTLVDTGMAGFASTIRREATKRFGSQQRPEAIILTHAHFDHSGNVRQLADYWDVPVYAHPMEMPYLIGKAELPPLDATVGGFMATMAHTFPPSGTNISGRVQPFPADGTVPGMLGWRWIHTPGHTPGHTSLYHEGQRFLIAADAVTTMNQQQPGMALSATPQLNGPPTYATSDWTAAEASVRKLAALEPVTVASGHGLPLSGFAVAPSLHDLADHFAKRAIPQHGRYVLQPARTDTNGIISLPPARPDLFWPLTATVAATAIGAVSLVTWLRRRSVVASPPARS